MFVAAEKYFVESASPSEIHTRVNTFLITPAVCVCLRVHVVTNDEATHR